METNNNKKKLSDVPPRKTSAEIISEARQAISQSQMPQESVSGIKPLQTKRPFTPRDKERHLYGKQINKGDRPSSSFSLKYLQNEFGCNLLKKSAHTKPPPTPRQNSTTNLSEINDTIFNIGVKEPCKIRLPSLEDAKTLQKRKSFKNTSLEKLPEDREYNIDRTELVVSRNAFSSPKERTDFEDYGNKSSKTSMSDCFLLGPQNLNKIFDNKCIIENSERLFTSPPPKAHYNKDTVEGIVSELNTIDAHNFKDEKVQNLLEELYKRMEKENITSLKANPKIKLAILKCLYRFVESKNENILITIAKIILALNVTGNNLSGVCKLIFKISKNDKNDQLFLDKNILELFLDALGRSSPLDDAEACIYGYGAVKFLTMNQKILKKNLELGILPLMVLHIKIVNNAKIEKKGSIPQKVNHVLFQLTGALRNLASEARILESFISSGAVSQLCQTLDLFSNDVDVIVNVSRILSIVSSNENCCDVLNETESFYKVIIRLFEKYSEKEDIVVRLAYTLGNLVAKIDEARVNYFAEKSAVQCLIHLWQIYLERTLQVYSLKIDDEKKELANSDAEDVMIKVIRVIANLVINPEIGKTTNEKHGNILIDEFLKVLISNPFKKNEELVLSILSTLNNLSYYYSSDLELDIFHVKQVDIIEGILEYTTNKNKECVTETTRILGNLSRSKITRQFISETPSFNTLIQLLNTKDLTLLKTTIGVFVNLMSDNKCRAMFRQYDGINKLIKILKSYCEKDWNLGTLICQVIWNYAIYCVDLYEIFSDNEIQTMLSMLADLLDEEKLFGTDSLTEEMEVVVTPEYLLWEEFAGVATNLLEKIENFLDRLDHIQVVNDESKVDNSKGKEMKSGSTNISFAAC